MNIWKAWALSKGKGLLSYEYKKEDMEYKVGKVKYSPDYKSDHLSQSEAFKKAVAPYVRLVEKPWGSYEDLFRTPQYVVKIVKVNPGHRLSLQKHNYREEHWYVVAGEADLTANSQTVILYPGYSADIERGVWHRVTNNQPELLVFVEIQTGLCYEDDIERMEDDYGRQSPITEQEIKQGFINSTETEEEKRARNKDFYEMYG